MSKLNFPKSGIILVISSYLFFGLDGTSSILDIGSKPELIKFRFNFFNDWFNSNIYSCDSPQV